MSMFTKATPPFGCYAHRKSPPLQRFFSKVKPTDDGCWQWIGARCKNGYGQLGQNYKVEYAHRAAYRFFVGTIPAGLHIDHLCNNRGCVNPDHLEAVTQAENNQRSWDRRKAAAA